MAICQSIVGGREFRIRIDCLLKIFRGFSFFVVSAAHAEPIQMIVAQKISLEHFGIYLLWYSYRRKIRYRQAFLNVMRNILGHFLLKREQIAKLSFVAAGPQVFVRGAV